MKNKTMKRHNLKSRKTKHTTKHRTKHRVYKKKLSKRKNTKNSNLSRRHKQHGGGWSTGPWNPFIGAHWDPVNGGYFFKKGCSYPSLAQTAFVLLSRLVRAFTSCSRSCLLLHIKLGNYVVCLGLYCVFPKARSRDRSRRPTSKTIGLWFYNYGKHGFCRRQEVYCRSRSAYSGK